MACVIETFIREPQSMQFACQSLWLDVLFITCIVQWVIFENFKICQLVLN